MYLELHYALMTNYIKFFGEDNIKTGLANQAKQMVVSIYSIQHIFLF